MQEPEEKTIITCPKCKGISIPGQEACPACSGTGKLSLKKITKKRSHEEPSRNWFEELRRRGLWG